MPKRTNPGSQENEPKQKKLRSAVFTDAENDFLLKNFATTFYKCKNKKERIVELKSFETKMSKVGFNRSFEEIEGRLNNLRQQYKLTVKDLEAGMAIKWKFYPEMDGIMKAIDQEDINNNDKIFDRIQSNLMPNYDYYASSSSVSTGSPPSSVDESPFLYQIFNNANKQKTASNNYFDSQLPHKPCPFGPIAPPIRNPVKSIHVEILDNTHMPANFQEGLEIYNRINRKASTESLAKPWKEFSETEEENLETTSTSSNYDDIFCLDVINENQQNFINSNEILQVESYTEFQDTFNMSLQRCSTPIQELTDEFGGKCTLVEKMSFSTSSSEYDTKENTKPKVKPKIRGKEFKKHFEDISKGCSYCFKSGRHELIVASHTLMDSKNRTLCPYLRVIECKYCKADGDNAHTYEECPARIFSEFKSRNRYIYPNGLRTQRRTRLFI